MTELIAVVLTVRCDVCKKATAVVDAHDGSGKRVQIVGMKPTTEGWLLVNLQNHNIEAHICPQCRNKK